MLAKKCVFIVGQERDEDMVSRFRVVACHARAVAIISCGSVRGVVHDTQLVRTVADSHSCWGMTCESWHLNHHERLTEGTLWPPGVRVRRMRLTRDGVHRFTPPTLAHEHRDSPWCSAKTDGTEIVEECGNVVRVMAGASPRGPQCGVPEPSLDQRIELRLQPTEFSNRTLLNRSRQPGKKRPRPHHIARA